MSRRITVLDLRDLDRYSALARTDGLLADPDIRDLTELLILDTAPEVGEHRAAFELLLSAHRVDRHLCVLVGRRPTAEASGHRLDQAVLRLPRQLEGVTLWLPHPDGIDWPYRASAPAKHHEAGERGLVRLVELLQLPEVFLQTTELLGQIPYGAACPGLGLAEGDEIRQEDHPWALRTAMERLLAPSDAPLAPEVETVGGRQSSVGSVKIESNSRIDHMLLEARQSVSEARQAAYDLTGELALFGERTPVLELLQNGADRLADLRTALLDLATGVRTSENSRKFLTDQGLVFPADAARSPEETGKSLEQSTRSWLKNGASLPQVGASLRTWANTLEDDGGHHGSFERALPSGLLDALRSPAVFPAPQRWLPLAGAAVSALAAVTPLGLLGGGLMAAAWTALMVWSVVRAPNRDGIHSVFLVLNAVTALIAGAGAGLLASSLPLSLALTCAVAAPLAALVVLFRCWRDRARQWVQEIFLDRAMRAADEASVLLERAAADWAALEAQTEARDALSRFQSAVGGIQRALGRRLSELDRETPGRPPRLRHEYLDAVRGQVCDLVLEALRPSLNVLHRYDLAAHSRDADHRAEALLREWRHHVDSHGPVEPPPFATERDDPALIPDERLAALVLAAAADPLEEMWQLCAPADLALLDVMGGPPAAVRFAPAAGRTAFRHRMPSDVLWISAPHSGVLRLAPLRAGTVRWSWGGESGEADSSEEIQNGTET